jgi:chemotaxis response regulator CheB
MTLVLIADDDHLIRVGLVELLLADPGIEVVGQAATGREALERVTAAFGAVASRFRPLLQTLALDVALRFGACAARPATSLMTSHTRARGAATTREASNVGITRHARTVWCCAARPTTG